MTTVSTKKSAKSKTLLPTILTLTLNADGTGTLLTKRGDLAYANSFTFQDLKGIIAAIQQGAARLVEIEQNPPPNALSVTPPSGEAQPAAPTEVLSTTEGDEASDETDAAETQSPNASEHMAGRETDEAGESATPSLLAGTNALPADANNPLSGVIRPANSVQIPLL